MISELSIRNFAIIPELTISFSKGFHVLTGETGAGKSIIIDAISLLIGGRASVDYVRHGAEKAEIEGLLFLNEAHPARALLKENDIDVEEDTIILRRDISSQGKSVCRINGKLVTLSFLRQLGAQIVDIHGQHEHQLLLRENKHLPLLDAYDKNNLEPHKREYHSLFKEYKEVSQAIRSLTEDEQKLAQRIDLLKYQLQEIEAAELQPSEEELLLQEKRKLSSAHKLFDGVDKSYQSLYNNGRALESLADVMHYLTDLAEIDSELKSSANMVEEIYYQLEDLSFSLGKYKDTIEFDPAKIDQLENRLAEMEALKRKYGSDIAEVLKYGEQIKAELHQLEHREERLDQLIIKQETIKLDLVIEAENLTKIRKKVATHLVKKIKNELRGLYMDKAEIDIEVTSSTSGERVEFEGEERYLREHGWDEAQIMISPNPGEPLKPLAKIASGGELSRLMLAIKTVFSSIEPVTTLIFDEVDTGVSGRVAQAMAERLYVIAKNQQILCITHQIQAAAMADHHYLISKREQQEQTITEINILTEREKVEALARMISGAEISTATLGHAEEIISSAKAMKEELEKALSQK